MYSSGKSMPFFVVLFRIYIPDAAWLLVYIIYQSLFLYMPMKVNLANSLPIASSIIVSSEQTRLMMKMHAFMRENVPRALKWKKQQSKYTNAKRSELKLEFAIFMVFTRF